jgi:hypothetical protein
MSYHNRHDQIFRITTYKRDTKFCWSGATAWLFNGAMGIETAQPSKRGRLMGMKQSVECGETQALGENLSPVTPTKSDIRQDPVWDQNRAAAVVS